MPFNTELRKLRKQDKLTQVELAQRLGIARSTIGMYEAGEREPNFETLEAIADYFNVDMNKLIGSYENALLPDNVIPMPKMNSVPLVGRIACGTPIYADENIEDYVEMPEHVHADFALRCQGDSMIGARIHDGDIVYIRQQPTVDNGQIAAVLIGDEATLKRVYRDESRLTLVAENAAFPPRVLDGDLLDSVRILGLAVAFTSAVK